jgi:hypothetical protein
VGADRESLRITEIAARKVGTASVCIHFVFALKVGTGAAGQRLSGDYAVTGFFSGISLVLMLMLADQVCASVPC